MVPPLMLSNENDIFGTGNALKNRVTACRKRLRLNRIHRTQVNTEPEEQFQIGASEFPGRTEHDPAVRGSLVLARDRERLQQVDEQEVGIT